MIQLKNFVFNSFQVNTFVLFDDSGECLIVDPANYSDHENGELDAFISKNNLKPVLIANTHCHVDHILGMKYLRDKYGIPTHIHEADLNLYKNAPLMGEVFGFNLDPLPAPETFIKPGDVVKFGQSELRAIHVPGHSPGSIAFHSADAGFVIVGDALFEGSIGRTDLPGGDYDTLINSIETNLFRLPGETVVWPGHGNSTTIEKEMRSNPFFNNYKT